MNEVRWTDVGGTEGRAGALACQTEGVGFPNEIEMFPSRSLYDSGMSLYAICNPALVEALTQAVGTAVDIPRNNRCRRHLSEVLHDSQSSHIWWVACIQLADIRFFSTTFLFYMLLA
ncbi:hypothetical protein J6590_048933 [Homalodisca vitripennis]|nr:hypothetical protein J6590_048933 [Homalodisca vitripennis]